MLRLVWGWWRGLGLGLGWGRRRRQFSPAFALRVEVGVVAAPSEARSIFNEARDSAQRASKISLSGLVE